MAENQARWESLQKRHAKLSARVERERVAQERQRCWAYDRVLVPFRDAFDRLKNVDLAELEQVAMDGVGELPDLELTRVRLSVSGAARAFTGGVGAGAGAGAATYAAVGAFATASTGTSISALSGAAATNATMAFLGGGSIAAGGGGIAAGTLVLGGVVAAPVLLAGAGFVLLHRRTALRDQRKCAAQLTKAEAQFAIDEERTEAVLSRGRQVRGTLRDLRHAAEARLPEFRDLVESNGDYETYTKAQVVQVATLLGLVDAIVALMATPLSNESGPSPDSGGQVLRDAQERLDDLDVTDDLADGDAA